MNIKLLKVRYIVIFLILIELLNIYLIYSNTKKEIDTFTNNKIETAKVEYRAIYTKLKEQSEIIFQEKINIPTVINIFKNADNPDLQVQSTIRKELYNYLLPVYIRLNKIVHLRQIHFHLKNNISFLRIHRPDIFGDDLSTIRQTVAYVNKYKKPIDGFEEGYINNGFRFVYPLFDENKNYLGSVETSFSVQTLKHILSNELHNSQFIILKSIVQEKVWKSEIKSNYNETGISPLFLIDKTAIDKLSMATLKRIRANITPKVKDAFTKKTTQDNAFALDIPLDKTTFLLTFLPVKNPISKKVTSYMILISEDNFLNTIHTKFWILQTTSFIFILIIFVFMYRIRVNQNKLIYNEAKYKRVNQLIENSNTILFYWKADEANWPVEHVTENISQFGYSPEDFLSAKIKFSDIIHPDDLAQIENEVSSYTEEFVDNFIQVYRIIDSKGNVRWVDDYTIIERDTHNNPIYYLGTIIDITEKKLADIKINKQEKIMLHLAAHDKLTDLPNRTLFLDRLSQSIKNQNTKVAVLFIDLDHFKQINDSMGHSVGDELLKKVSKTLLNQIASTDTLARFGGDEFAIILDDVQTTDSIIYIVKKLLDSMDRKITILEHDLYATLSIGIAIYPEDGLDSETLLKNADAAMYKAKDEGRNTYRFYNETMTQKALQRITMESDLRDALKKEEFVVYYQPQMDASQDILVGMEALVRWKHPTKGVISPLNFIPLAEQIGLIIPLDQWVMKTAMKQFVKWYKDGLNPGRLALNLAIKQLQQENFIDILSSLIEETQCKAEWLELEVTEGQIMSNPEQAIITLKKISDLGIELAIDDFGTGYSSLSYLKRLPINKLKIDQSFIRELPNDENDVGITKAVISLASSLNLRVIAEGVETKEQKDFLVQNGCHNIQGYFYSKPIPADELVLILKKCKPEFDS